MIYRVELERRERATVWVEADTEREAGEAAEEIVGPHDWYDFADDEVERADPEQPPSGTRYWTGGEDGEWATAP